MFINVRPCFFFLVFALCAAVAAASAQEVAPADSHDDGTISLDVVVAPKSGQPVSGLKQEDFTVLDNKTPQNILSFRALRERDESIEVVLVVDDVNTGITNIAFERSEIDKFLKIDGGRLSHPMALAFLTDDGVKIQDEFSSDGNALSAELAQFETGLHTIHRSGGVYSAIERFQISMQALFQVANHEAARPGRKIILWVSPGWPLLSGPGVEQQMTPKQEQQVFDEVVKVSNLLRHGEITLYSIDPLGSAESTGHAFHWEAFAKGISKPSQAEWGDLALQVIATQSGGLALTAGNDIVAFLKQCLADTQAYYEISFAPPLDQKRDEYHHIEIRLADRKLIARTRQGYYAQAAVH